VRRGLAVAAGIVLALGAACSTASARPSHKSKPKACDLVAAPGGSDSAAGTLSSPLATPQALSDKLQPGQIGCLRQGSYQAPLFVSPTSGPGYHEWTIERPDIVLRSYPGERAAVAGRVNITQTADRVVLSDLDLDGRNTLLLPSPTINSTGAVVRGNDITNYHTSICLLLGTHGYGEAIGTQILNNNIHGCGKLPAANHDHGIYVEWTDGTLIRGNTIFDNADRGIQLYPEAMNTLITGNVIAGNGEGVIFAGDSTGASSGNIVRLNIIAHSTVRNNLEASWEGPVGSNNVATRNCVWTDRGDFYAGEPIGSGIHGDPEGYSPTNNLVADPGITGLGGNSIGWRKDGPCANLLREGAAERVSAKAGKKKRGRVTIKGGAASADTVSIVRAHGRQVASAEVDPGGRFRVRVKARAHKLRVKAPGMRPSRVLKLR
jgi:parallel beta-helix repeat protein